MSMTSFLRNAKDSMLKTFSGDMSNMFILTTIVGYLSSAAGQLYGINANPKLDKDKKKFLNFQEMADCGINIAAYLLITKNLVKLTKGLTSSGKVLSQPIINGCEKFGIEVDKVKNIGSEITKKLSELKGTKDIEALKGFQQDIYAPFESGMSMAGTIAGGLISSSFIAPVLRNKYASAKKNSNAEVPQIVTSPVLPKASMRI